MTVHAAAGLDRQVSHVRLWIAPRDAEAAAGALVVCPVDTDELSPEVDGLILQLYRLEAGGLVLPGRSLPESARLLAEELAFAVVLVERDALNDFMQMAWQRIHAQELVVIRAAEELHADLTAAWRDAAGVEAYLARAGRILGCEIRLLEAKEAADGGDGVAHLLPIVWGRGSGNLLAVGPSTVDAPALERVLPSLLLMASVLVDREATRIESDLRVRGELLLELLLDQGAPTGSVIRAAERFGMDLGEEHLVAIWDLDDFAASIARNGLTEVRILRLKRDIAQALEREASAAFGRAWVLPHSDDFVLVAGTRSAERAQRRTIEIMREIQAKLEPILDRHGVKGVAVGLGYPYSGARGLRRSFDEAREALVVGRAQFGAGSITHFADLGLHRFLYGWFETPRSRALAQDFLRPLLEEDERGRAQLLETLRVYLESRGRSTQAASQLGIHRNTLRYRLDRIESLLGVDLEGTNVQLILQLILRTLPD